MKKRVFKKQANRESREHKLWCKREHIPYYYKSLREIEDEARWNGSRSPLLKMIETATLGIYHNVILHESDRA